MSMNFRTAQDAQQAHPEEAATHTGHPPPNAEWRLNELGINLPAPAEPFGTYVEAVPTGNLLFLSGMLPIEHLLYYSDEETK